MKKLWSIITAAALTAAVFAACAGKQPDNSAKASPTSTPSEATEAKEAAQKPYESRHTLYFKNSAKSGKAVATFFNSRSGKTEDVAMQKISEDSGGVTFSCEGDSESYNMAFVTCDGRQSDKFAFNPCVSGWYQTEDDLKPYTQGKEINYDTPKMDEVTLTCIDYDKLIHIWKPADYDAEAAEQYDTIYVLDGQILVYLGKYGQQLVGCPVATEQVSAMCASTGTKAIVVAIENVGTRDFELIPNIGVPMDQADFEGEGIDGTKFADFVAKTLVPYVQQHYNVSTDARRTSIVGASLGGMESFYIAEEYPEIFGTGGSLSPSFWEYDDATWSKYLSGKRFSDSSPFIYLYTGPQEFDTDPHVTDMYNRLKKMGYPEDKLVLHFNPDGAHGVNYWCCVFPEFLTAAVYQRVEPLQQTAA